MLIISYYEKVMIAVDGLILCMYASICIHSITTFCLFQLFSVTGLECHLCHVTFSDQSALHGHHVTAHAQAATQAVRAKPGEGTHECELCGKRFTEKRNMRRHQSITHGVGDVKKFPCHVCARVFTQKWHLTKHLNNVHKTQ